MMNRSLRACTFMAVMFMVVIVAEAGPRVMTFENGDRYEGEFRDGEFHGRGVYTWAIGDRYEGELRDGEFHGHGVYTWADGARYEGEFRDDKFHGRAVFTAADGSRYEGEFRDDKRYSRAVLTEADGSRYKGEFRDDKRHSRAVPTEAEGSRYEGEFRDDKRYSRAVPTEADGSRYEGEFRDDKRYSRAVPTEAEGSRYEGEFRDDKRYSRAVPTEADGSRYEGEFRDDKRHSRAVFTTADGQRYEEYYIDGELAERVQQTATLSAAASPAPSPRKLQAALAVHGFDPGPVDGKIGAKTRVAIAQWQESVGQEPTGTLDATQQTALVNSVFGEQAGQEEQSSAQESSAPTDNDTLTDTVSGGCAERMDKMESDITAVTEAIGDYIRRRKNEYGGTGLSACGSSIIGYNVTLNYVEALRRCPESDPTGEQLAAQETYVEKIGASADMICAGGIDSRQRHSMKDLLDRLTSLTPLDQWQNGGQGRTEHWQDETVDQLNQGNQGRSEQRNQDDQGRSKYRRNTDAVPDD